MIINSPPNRRAFLWIRDNRGPYMQIIRSWRRSSPMIVGSDGSRCEALSLRGNEKNDDLCTKSACTKGGHIESRSTRCTIFGHSFIRGWINLSKSPAHIGASIKYKSLSLIYCSLAAFDMLNGSAQISREEKLDKKKSTRLQDAWPAVNMKNPARYEVIR